MKKIKFFTAALVLATTVSIVSCSKDDDNNSNNSSINVKLNGANYPINHKLGVEAKATSTDPVIAAWISTLSVNLNQNAPLTITPASPPSTLCGFTSTNLIGLSNKVINITFTDSNNSPMINGIDSGVYTNQNITNAQGFSFMILDSTLPNGYAYPVDGSSITITKNVSQTSINIKGSFALKDNIGNINQNFEFPNEGIDVPYSNCQ
jgi:hypothetical protein